MRKRLKGVYLLVSKSTGKKYVGSSSVSIKERISAHRWDLQQKRHCNKHLQSSFDKRGWSDFEAWTLEVVEDAAEVVAAEQFWINDLRPEFNMLAVAGSCLGRKHTPEAKAKMAVVATGRKLSQEHREKVRQANLARFSDPEERARHSERMKNRDYSSWVDAEYRKKLSLSSSGRKASPEALANMSASQKGRPKSAEHRAKLSQSLKGKTLPEEVKQKLRESLKGRVFSEEHRARLKAAAQARAKKKRDEAADVRHQDRHV